MSDPVMPRYPVYVPSKGRADTCMTPKFLARDGVPFYLVIEPQEADAYGQRFGYERLLLLPWSGNDTTRQQFTGERGIENGGLIAARNWIKEHSLTLGAARHWQFDDNIWEINRWWKGLRLPCAAGVAIAAVEDFTDRYENIAISGMNYHMFAFEKAPPFNVNCHVYSCSLILNSIPHRWRIAYNDDTDICLQVLSDGWCTTLINVFLVRKIATMEIKGGNTTDLYQGDGRLKMARSLERLWPGVVTTRRRFQRPQHVVKDAWRRFDTPLRLRPDVDLSALPAVNEYGMELVAVKEVKSQALRDLLAERPHAE